MTRPILALAPVLAALFALGAACGSGAVTAADLTAGDPARTDAAVARLVEAGAAGTPLVGQHPTADGELTAPPLVWAVLGGAGPEALGALLAAGVDVEAPDDRGATALIHAAGTREPAVVRLLFEAGADVDARAADHQGVFDAARSNPVLKADPLYAELVAAQTVGSRHSGAD